MNTENEAKVSEEFIKGIAAAKDRIKEVNSKSTLIYEIPDDEWEDWNSECEDALVTDSSFEDD